MDCTTEKDYVILLSKARQLHFKHVIMILGPQVTDHNAVQLVLDTTFNFCKPALDKGEASSDQCQSLIGSHTSRCLNL